MPFFKSGDALIYYAHVPKCGGSSIAEYITERFGPLGFHDNFYTSLPVPQRWTRSSPQHVDRRTLERLIPLEFFDAMFAIVRHPVPRTISSYHFQQEVERTIPQDLSFSEWLAQLDPESSFFAMDNHVLPMNRIVPEGTTVFHLEHGLDALILWFDKVTGTVGAPRAFNVINSRGAHVKGQGVKIEPTDADLARIATLYAEDFKRFGYDPMTRQPNSPPPEITPEFIAAREADLRRMNAPRARLRRKLQGKFKKWLRS